MKRKLRMPGMKAESQNLQGLFLNQLRDLYNAENQLVKALPKMVQAASSEELRSALDEHLEVTQEHVNRLEKIFAELDEESSGEKCEGMKGLLTEGEEAIKKKNGNSLMKDADLIAAAQRVEHYEIAGYGTVRTFAERLGLSDAAQMLQQTLNEEKQADKTLTNISEHLLAQQKEQEEQTIEDSD